MKIKLLFIIIFITHLSQAQTGITGVLMDTTNLLPIPLASVSLIQASDSSLVSFSRTDAQGHFKVFAPQSGQYLALFSHPSFVDYVEKYILGPETKDLGELPMMTREHMLKEVLIKQKGQIFIKGDTLEYILDSIKLDANANVEDLLSALPGMQVDKDGNITAQGQKVEKVLVDGEEFFGNDPTMVTKNLRADAVDKVQVFDKKTEEAQFTGIDDGNSQKTINIKLKDDQNRGTFGKISLHGGTDDIWDNALMVNNFKAKRKLSAYGIASSNGTSGLNWQDMQQYGSGERMMEMDDGDMISYTDNEIEYNGVGRPKVWTGGLHYNNKWNDKHTLSGNLNGGQMNITQNITQNTNTYLNDVSYTNVTQTSSLGIKDRIGGDMKYDWAIDSSLTLGIRFNASLTHSSLTDQEANSNRILESDSVLSSNNNYTQYKDTSRIINGQINLRKKFKKIGRTLSAYYSASSQVSLSFNNNNIDLIYSTSENHSIQKTSNHSNSAYNQVELTYTEPLYKTEWILELSQIYLNKNQSSENNVQAANVNTMVFSQIDSLTNDFDFDYINNKSIVRVQYQKKKFTGKIGFGMGFADFQRTDNFRPQNSSQFKAVNIYPEMRLNFKFSQFRNLNFSYNGSTNQPNITQIQPIYNYTNPLNIVIGNPNLNQEYRQYFNANYWNYNAFKERSFWIGGNFSNTFDRISTVTNWDNNLGRTVSTFQNLDGYYSFRQWLGYYKKLNTHWSWYTNFNSSFFQYPYITNSIEGKSRTISLSPSFSFTYKIDKKLNIDFEIDYDQNFTKNPSFNQKNSYGNWAPVLHIKYYPITRIKLETRFDYINRQKTPPFTTNFTRLLWGLYASGYLNEAKSIEIKLTCNDLLNQNKGYDRTSFNNTITEKYYNNIARYFMLGINYNFATGPMKKTKSLDDDEEQW